MHIYMTGCACLMSPMCAAVASKHTWYLTAAEPTSTCGSIRHTLMLPATRHSEDQTLNAHLHAVQSARMARLITSGDGTLIQAEPSTSGELPPHIGPPGRQNSLEFLPVLPPMHIHSHPVTTGHGQFVSSPMSHDIPTCTKMTRSLGACQHFQPGVEC